MIIKLVKTYTEMLQFDNYNDRLEYLFIGDNIGHETFGSARWMNQLLYRSPEWKRVRDMVIARDRGCDLGVEGCDLDNRRVLIHHINPITEDDVVNRRACIFDVDNLIAVSHSAHNYIHFGNRVNQLPLERTPNDTCPWRR